VLSILPFIYLADITIGENNNKPEIKLWIVASIIIPVLETFFNQYLPFKLMQSWHLTKNKYGLYIVISAIIFGLCHCYSIQYMIFAFSVGLVLGYTYCFYSKTPKIAFWSTTLIHGLRNSIVFLPILLNNN
jgi:membrane protease YdiL (CAAX protease family)